MRDIDSEGKSYLLFPDQLVIHHRWQTVGLILVPETNNPSCLNIFRVFISGNSREKVEKFVDYQIRQGRKKGKAIQVQVEKLDPSQLETSQPVPEPEIPPLEELKKQIRYAEKEQPDFLYNFGKITVGIDRVYMNTKPPYRIKYTIDPPTKFLLMGENYSFEFSADRPFISIQAHQGNLHLHLFESRPFGDRLDHGGIDATAGETKVFPAVAKQFAGMWQAHVTGVKLENTFTIDYFRDIF
jgi:hypothetical protein